MLVLLVAILVVALNAYAAALVMLRARLYGTRLYRPMLWNIGLSMAPLAIQFGALVIFGLGVLTSPVAVFAATAVLVVVWTAFVPNSSYLITELNFSHRRPEDPVPLWYDIILTFTLATSGVINGIVSLSFVHFLIAILFDPDNQAPLAPPASWAAAVVFILLSSVGIYIGRYARLNSWDLLHPIALARKLVTLLAQTGQRREMALFVVTHAVLLTLLYALVFAPLYASIT